MESLVKLDNLGLGNVLIIEKCQGFFSMLVRVCKYATGGARCVPPGPKRASNIMILRVVSDEKFSLYDPINMGSLLVWDPVPKNGSIEFLVYFCLRP